MVRKLALNTAVVCALTISACGDGDGDGDSNTSTNAEAPSDVDGTDAVDPDAADTTSSPDTSSGSSEEGPFSDAPNADDSPAEDTAADTDTDTDTDVTPMTADDVARVDAAGNGADNGPDDQRPVGENGDTGLLAGLWDHSRDTPDGRDIRFFALDAEGRLTEYDYQADAIGSGADCHVITTTMIVSRGNDRYDIQDSSSLPGSNSIDDVLITTANGVIVFRYIGEAFDPTEGGEFGPEGATTQAGVTVTFPAVVDREADSLNVCVS